MAWLHSLIDRSDQIITSGPHGDLPRWRKALENLPEAKHYFAGGSDAPVLGLETADSKILEKQLREFHPWRKGPLKIGGIKIDTEWRSNWKWDRISKHLNLDGHRVLDVGCGNGYYGWRILHHGAASVTGIDPTLAYVMQWLACHHFSGDVPNYVLPLAIEDLPEQASGFDTVFSMGVLYHRRDPVSHLQRLASLLKPGGQLLMETLIIEGDGERSLVPEQRYARMRNVWALPSIDLLSGWMSQAGFENIRLLDVSHTRVEEQRTTDWMRFESLSQSLYPGDSTRTIEGHPAPVRAALLSFSPGTKGYAGQ